MNLFKRNHTKFRVTPNNDYYMLPRLLTINKYITKEEEGSDLSSTSSFACMKPVFYFILWHVVCGVVG